jgi:uncharacterized protein
MEKVSTTDQSFFMRILWLLLLLVGGLMMTFLLYFSGVFISAGLDPAQLEVKLQDLASNVGAMRWMQTIQSFCVFILPPFLFCKIQKVRATKYLQIHKPSVSALAIAILSIPAMSPIINILVEWNLGLHLPESLHGVEIWMRQSEDAAQKVTDIMLSGNSVLDLIVNLLLVAGLAGIGEELLFRGLLQRILSDGIQPKNIHEKYPTWVMHTSIWIVAILFSTIHLQFYGFFARLLLGAWFGYLLWWSGSLWVPILAHFTNNAISTVVTYYDKGSGLTQQMNQFGLGSTWWICLISVLCIGGMAWFLIHQKKETLF